MPFALFKGEKNINDLVSRIFNIQGTGSTAARKQAAAALLKANPQLQDMASVPAGTVINVPNLPQAVNPGEISQPPVISLSQPGAFTLDRIDALRQTLASISADDANDANATLALVQKPEVQAAATQNPALAQLLPQLTQQAQADLRQLQTEQTLYAQAITEMQQALAKFGS